MCRSDETAPLTSFKDSLVLLGILDREATVLVQSILEANGYTVVLVNDGRDLLDNLTETENALAVLSPSFLDRCRLESWLSNVGQRFPCPFILWVGDEPIDLDQVVRALQQGAAGVVHGEFHDQKLLSLVDGLRPSACSLSASKFESDEGFLLGPLPETNGSTVSDSVQNGIRIICNNTPPPNARSIPRQGSVRLPRAFNENKLREVAEVIQGNSPALTAIRQLIVDVAETCATVMIYGESGTGKELVASALHRLSKRSSKPFVPVNMSAIPEGLSESLLFGHEKGAFTNALQTQPGWCALADGGTLFLDEIGEMELALQPKLLRFLQEGAIQRVGSGKQTKVDVRLITATNRDPKLIVQEGRLREDLFFRLHVVPIYLPPLRERREDIVTLAQLFLVRAAARYERSVRGYTDEALEVLTRFHWPGNVRQLENAVERIVIFSRHEVIQAMDVPAEFHAPAQLPQQRVGHQEEASDRKEFHLQWLTPIQINERVVLIDALQKTGGHVVEAARLLGLGQATMYRKIKLYALPHERKHRRGTAPK